MGADDGAAPRARRVPVQVWYLVAGVVLGGVLVHLRNSGHEIARRMEGTRATLDAHKQFNERMILKPLDYSAALAVGINEKTIFDDMVRWMLQNGAILPHLNRTKIGVVKKGDALIRGVVATAPLRADTVFAYVPERLLLGRESLLHTAMRVPILRERVSMYVSLILALLYEMKRAQDSPASAAWAPYMRFLSTVTLETPVSWPKEKLERASPVLQKLVEMTVKAQVNTFNALRAKAPDALELCGGPSFQTFQRAWEMAASRFWQMRTRAFISPYADMLNFGEHNNTCDLAMRDANMNKLRPGSDRKATLAKIAFEFYIRQDYAPGEEVLFYYNKHCAEEFIMYYGFEYPGAPPCTHTMAGKRFWFKRNLRGGVAAITD